MFLPWSFAHLARRFATAEGLDCSGRMRVLFSGSLPLFEFSGLLPPATENNLTNHMRNTHCARQSLFRIPEPQTAKSDKKNRLIRRFFSSENLSDKFVWKGGYQTKFLSDKIVWKLKSDKFIRQNFCLTKSSDTGVSDNLIRQFQRILPQTRFSDNLLEKIVRQIWCKSGL